MDLDRILNEALNEAMCIESKRIKRPNSNKIAQFVMDFIERKNLKNDLLHSVSHCSKCKQPLKGEKVVFGGYNICTCNWDTSNCG